MVPDPDRKRSSADSFIGYLSELTGEHRQRFELILETIAEVSASLGEEDMLRSVVDRAVAITGAERAILMLRDRWGALEPGVARDAEGRDLPPDETFSRSICERVAASGKPDRETHPRFGDLTKSISKARIRSTMCVPLRVRGRVIGTLYVDSRALTSEFTAADLSLFKAIAYELALAVEYARIAKKERSLAVAREVQRNLLPDGPAARSGLDIHGVSRPSEEMGGDFFDYLELPDNRFGLAIGDVSGNGIQAGLHMATARGQLRAVTSMEPDIGRAMGTLNRLLAADFADRGLFMSAFLGIFEGRSLRYVGAGIQYPPLLLRAGTDRAERLDRNGPALGHTREVSYEVSDPVEFETGDILVLYTDGVTEARGRDGAMFGEERLRHALRVGRDRSARGIVEGIVGSVGADCEDDLTVVAVKAVE